jgi:hypothetical protein
MVDVRHPDAEATPATAWVFAGYLLAQAVVGVLFWVTLAASPTAREWLELVPEKPEVTDAFVFADAVVVAGSAVGAWAVLNRRSWAVPVVAFTAGGLVYPTLFLACWVAVAGTGAVTLAVMLAPSSLTTWVAWQLWRDRR